MQFSLFCNVKSFNRLFVAALLVFLGSAVASTLAFADQHGKKPVQVLFKNVNIFDGFSDKLQMNMSVLVEANYIKEVGKNIKKPADAYVVDGKGRTMTPGLIDMHQHLTLNGGTASGEKWDAYVQGAHASRAAEYLLKSGFTTIRDIANDDT